MIFLEVMKINQKLLKLNRYNVFLLFEEKVNISICISRKKI